jgi:hypothetical protein
LHKSGRSTNYPILKTEEWRSILAALCLLCRLTLGRTRGK